jgi:hypothetical protein
MDVPMSTNQDILSVRQSEKFQQAVAELARSPQFQSWGRLSPEDLEQSQVAKAGEKHFTPDALAVLWGISAETVRIVFRDEPDVLRLAQPNEGKRKYVLMRIPESVADRVHKRLSAVPR